MGVRVTPDQHRVLTEAAKREHRSVNSFVVQAALRAAEHAASVPALRRTPEQIKAILQTARAEVRAVMPRGRDLLEEFLAERRQEAARE